MVKNREECEFDGCDRPKSGKGLCRSHYLQQWHGRPLTPLRKLVIAYKDEFGRVCTKCGRFKEWSEYYVRANGIPRSQCKPCVIAQHTEDAQKKRALESKEPQRARTV